MNPRAHTDPEITPGQAPADLDRYLARIGYHGPRTPDLPTLQALLQLHPAAIPFEALDVLLDRRIDLSPGALVAKLVDGRRGGYCFEHNLLLKAMLEAMGFTVEGLIGRVMWMRPPGAPPRPLTHMALRVTVHAERWLADVGFGTCVPATALRFDVLGEHQPARHETFRLTRADGWTVLEAQLPGGWQPLYTLSPLPQLDVDYQAPNWFTSTHPDSMFRHDLLAARTLPDRRITLLNDRLTIRHAGGALEQRHLDRPQLGQAITESLAVNIQPALLAAVLDKVLMR